MIFFTGSRHRKNPPTHPHHESLRLRGARHNKKGLVMTALNVEDLDAVVTEVRSKDPATMPSEEDNHTRSSSEAGTERSPTESDFSSSITDDRQSVPTLERYGHQHACSQTYVVVLIVTRDTRQSTIGRHRRGALERRLRSMCQVRSGFHHDAMEASLPVRTAADCINAVALFQPLTGLRLARACNRLFCEGCSRARAKLNSSAKEVRVGLSQKTWCRSTRAVPPHDTIHLVDAGMRHLRRTHGLHDPRAGRQEQARPPEAPVEWGVADLIQVGKGVPPSFLSEV
jgi:hypothetical protein